jgi:hypothetical protein
MFRNEVKENEITHLDARRNDCISLMLFKPIDMEVCYWALLFMPLVILHHLMNLFVQLANKRGFKKKKTLHFAIF